VTADSVIQRTRTKFNPATEQSTVETVRGVCTCGSILTGEVYQCYFSDLVCSKCSAIQYNGRIICRRHAESYVGSKEETIVLVGIALGLKPEEIGKMGCLSKETVMAAKGMLLIRSYVKIKLIGIIGNSAKLTKPGDDAIRFLISVYKKDLDFADFLKRVGLKEDVGGR
jgi:hypothetical protein